MLGSGRLPSEWRFWGNIHFPPLTIPMCLVFQRKASRGEEIFLSRSPTKYLLLKCVFQAASVSRVKGACRSKKKRERFPPAPFKLSLADITIRDWHGKFNTSSSTSLFVVSFVVVSLGGDGKLGVNGCKSVKLFYLQYGNNSPVILYVKRKMGFYNNLL